MPWKLSLKTYTCKIHVKHQLKYGISLLDNNLNISFTRKYVEITLLIARNDLRERPAGRYYYGYDICPDFPFISRNHTPSTGSKHCKFTLIKI